MSTTVKIRRCEDTTAADVAEAGLQNVRPGDVVEVPTELAGRAPHWRRLSDGEQEVPWREHRDHAGHREVRDLGHGLLSQVGNWEELPSSPTPPTTATDAGTEGA